MAVVRKIGLWSFAKLQAIMMAMVGLLIGLFFVLFAGTVGFIAGSEGGGLLAGLGFISIIVFPIIYGVMGLVIGFGAGLFYNLAARMVGGMSIDLE
jgi:hypothetical protein